MKTRWGRVGCIVVLFSFRRRTGGCAADWLIPAHAQNTQVVVAGARRHDNTATAEFSRGAWRRLRPFFFCGLDASGLLELEPQGGWTRRCVEMIRNPELRRSGGPLGGPPGARAAKRGHDIRYAKPYRAMRRRRIRRGHPGLRSARTAARPGGPSPAPRAFRRRFGSGRYAAREAVNDAALSSRLAQLRAPQKRNLPSASCAQAHSMSERKPCVRRHRLIDSDGDALCASAKGER